MHPRANERAGEATVVVLEFGRHMDASAGQRSGRNSERGTPVSRSIAGTNSAGTPFLERVSQYQTCDCVVPIRSARGFWPPARSQARFNASRDMGTSNYPILSDSQLKNLCVNSHRNFSNARSMREVDPRAFGARVRERRDELELSQPEVGKAAGYSQQRIASIEKGDIKRPERAVRALAEALYTTPEWLCWGEGRRSTGRPFLTPRQLAEKYNAMSETEKADLSEYIGKPRLRRKIA